MEMITLIVLRSVERLLAVLIGGFFTWLGYRLFLDIPAKADSSGKFNLPGGMAIHLVRVGPGIFFSLFGTCVVLMSFMKPVDFKQGTPPASAKGGTSLAAASSYSGATPTVTAKFSRTEIRGLRVPDIRFLNRLQGEIRLDPSERASVEAAFPQIKLAIMETLWGDDWGDLARFGEWVNSGETNGPPELAKAVQIFNSR